MDASVGKGDQKELIERIEDDIYLGHLAPGMWLKQIDLEQKYGSTRLALRTALDQIASRGLVVKIPNRGFYVPTFDDESLRLVRDARARIERSIAHDITVAITEPALGILHERAEEFAETVRSGTFEQQDKANFAFHAEILKFSPNQVICDMIWTLRRRIPLTVQRQDNTRERLELSSAQHFAMIDALRARDADAFEALITKHILG